MRPMDTRIYTQVREWNADLTFSSRCSFSIERNHLSSMAAQQHEICYSNTGAFNLAVSMSDKLKRARRGLRFDKFSHSKNKIEAHLYDVSKSSRGAGKLVGPEARLGSQLLITENKIEDGLDQWYPGSPLDNSIMYK